MSYSCSDFTSDIVNHLFSNGLIASAVVHSADLERQGAAAMAAISALAKRANQPLALAAGQPTATALEGEPPAARFMAELLAAHETLTDIAECKGARTLADCMYLLSAIQKGTFIEVFHPTESNILEVVNSLPSAAAWMAYVSEVSA